ncbi:B12-binding domain-containing radical SAM protein [bacterium]|nr:B12-binding domain-containing radical SAM protein [bacterium]
MRKKVILVYPKTGWDVKNVSVLLPLAVMYLGRPLRRAGFDPVIVDQRVTHRWLDRIRSLISEGEVAAIGISCMTGEQVRFGLEAARAVRQAAPDLPIVWGGVHPSLLPIETARHPLVDYVVYGEGEDAFVELVQALGDDREPTGIGNVTYIDRHGEPVHGPVRPFMPLADVLVPDYDLVNVDDYITTQTLGERDLAVMTSRGCPSRCSFCYNVVYASRRWRAQPAEAVVEHFVTVAKRFGVNAILVKDDNYFVNKRRAVAIAEGMRRAGLKVTVRAECRADYISSRHYGEDVLNELAAAGFREMTVGAESGTEIGLNTLLKDITVDDIRVAARRLADAKIATKFTFMTGFPGETWENVLDTLKLMLELVATSPYARVTPLHLYAPYPGTPLYDQAVEAGWHAPESLDGWADVDFHNTDMPWLDDKMRRRLERMSVSTYFLDGRTMPEYFNNAPVMKMAARVYGAVVRYRARNNFFSFMPELRLMELYRRASA